MSQPDFESASVPSVITKKPLLNIYTAMLIISLVALLLAVIFLALEWKAYNYDAGSQTASVTAPVTVQEAIVWT